VHFEAVKKSRNAGSWSTELWQLVPTNTIRFLYEQHCCRDIGKLHDWKRLPHVATCFWNLLLIWYSWLHCMKVHFCVFVLKQCQRTVPNFVALQETKSTIFRNSNDVQCSDAHWKLYSCCCPWIWCLALLSLYQNHFFYARFIILPWKWMQNVFPKRRYGSPNLCCATS
jgi:hypothetical protein